MDMTKITELSYDARQHKRKVASHSIQGVVALLPYAYERSNPYGW